MKGVLCHKEKKQYMEAGTRRRLEKLIRYGEESLTYDRCIPAACIRRDKSVSGKEKE